MKDFPDRMRRAKVAPPEPKDSTFVRFADWISTAMGTPANIIFWVVLVLMWIGLFALHILGPNSNVLPDWFTSNAFNFPLNTVTTLAELYIGFLIAAAANRVEKKNRQLHEQMLKLVEKEETEIEELLQPGGAGGKGRVAPLDDNMVPWGAPLSKEEKEDLLMKLKVNRSNAKNGAGTAYWLSVVKLVDEFIQNRKP